MKKQTKQNISPGMAKTYPSLELFKMGEVKVYWYANKLLEGKKPWLGVFADFHGVNIPILTSFKLWFNNQVTSPEYLTVGWNHFQQTFVHVLNSTWTSTWWGYCSANENGPSQCNVSSFPRNRNFQCPYLRSKLDRCSRNLEKPRWRWMTWLFFFSRID